MPALIRRDLLALLGATSFSPLAACFTPDDRSDFILTRDDAAYAALNVGYNLRLRFLPKYIAACRSESDVQAALKRARDENLPVAVRSGGHCFEGFSSNDGGMVINVAAMKTVQWLDSERVSLGAGCMLQEVQTALFPRKRLLPSGSCGTVGLAGLTLGGGYGFFSRSHGLTCDSLLGLTMVTPAGQVVDTDTDAELLWACKGGGNGSFGVVTSLRFKTYAMPPRFDSLVLKFRLLDAARFEQALSTWFAMSDGLPPEAFSAFVLNGRTLTVLITSYADGFDLSGATTRPLQALASQVEMPQRTPLPQAMKRYYGRKGPIDFKNASAGLYRGAVDVLPLASALFERVVAHSGIVFQINTLGGRINDPAFEKASCYPHRALPYLGELQAYWERAAAAPALIRAFEDIQALFRAGGITAHYANYPDLGFADWPHAYYGNSYARLQQLKRRLDPGNVLRHPQSVRPA